MVLSQLLSEAPTTIAGDEHKQDYQRNTNKVKLSGVDLSVVCLGLTAVAVPEEILAGASVEYL